MTWVLNGNGRWHTLFHCLGGDTVTLSVVVVLSLLNIVIYLLIARLHHKQKQLAGSTKAVNAINSMVTIFVLCAVLGYGWNVVKIYYPAWPIWSVGMLMLIVMGIRYLITMSDNVAVIYHDLTLAHRIRKKMERYKLADDLKSLQDLVAELRVLVNDKAEEVKGD